MIPLITGMSIDKKLNKAAYEIERTKQEKGYIKNLKASNAKDTEICIAFREQVRNSILSMKICSHLDKKFNNRTASNCSHSIFINFKFNKEGLVKGIKVIKSPKIDPEVIQLDSNTEEKIAKLKSKADCIITVQTEDIAVASEKSKTEQREFAHRVSAQVKNRAKLNDDSKKFFHQAVHNRNVSLYYEGTYNKYYNPSDEKHQDAVNFGQNFSVQYVDELSIPDKAVP